MPFELTPFMDNRLFLIDGHALIFKMYYAFLRHPMINSKGVDTSILFGVTKYILELIEREKPSHIAVAFDPPGGTFRHDLYPAYKGTREATPQLVIDALAPLTELCEALKIKVLMVKGYEADDVIGSMAIKAEKEGYTVNVEASIQKMDRYIEKTWDHSDFEIEMELKKEEPKIKAADLSTIEDELGSFSTDAGGGERWQNLSTGVSKLNGTILMPGESLSVCDATAPFDAEQGYVEA